MTKRGGRVNQEWRAFMAGQTWSKEWQGESGEVREQWIGTRARSGGPLWPGKPGPESGGIDDRNRTSKIESGEVDMRRKSEGQEWRAFMAGKTWKQP